MILSYIIYTVKLYIFLRKRRENTYLRLVKCSIVERSRDTLHTTGNLLQLYLSKEAHMTDNPDSSVSGTHGYVIDAENAAEMARLMLQDRLLTQSMGGLISEPI